MVTIVSGLDNPAFEMTEKTLLDYFREVGQPSVAYRLLDFLRTERLVLVRAEPAMARKVAEKVKD